MSESVIKITDAGSTAWAIFDEEFGCYLGDDEICALAGSETSWTSCKTNRRTFTSRYRADKRLQEIQLERENKAI